MKQLIIDTIPFEFKISNLNESHSNGKLTVSGILQRANAKNQNGRIYPKDVLMREANIYNDNFVKHRRALGELDHPACFSPSAEILTENGFKLLSDVIVGENVPTLNTTTNSIEYSPIEKVINEPYKGKMISIKGRSINTMVTPNHRFVLNDRNGNLIEKTAQEILDISKSIKCTHLSIPIVADKWEGKHYDTFTIPGIQINNIHSGEKFKEKHAKDLIVNASAFFSFLGFYLAEGWCYNRSLNHKNPSYRVNVCQNEGEISEQFRELAKKISPELEWTENSNGGKLVVFSTSDARLHAYLSVLGNKYTKYVPDEIKNTSSDLLQNLYDWYLNGDGSCVGIYERSSIFSVSKQMMEDFYEILLKIGVSGIIKEIVPGDGEHVYGDHIIKGENCKPLHRLWIRTSKAIHLDFRFIKIEEVDYDGTVHCISVKNGTFYCRDNNHSFWTGNSEVVNLKNVSHNILETKWIGDDLIGTIEILTTPSGNILRELLQSGILLGISSRGVGSVKRDIRESADIVQDDYSLISYDAVSSPSTQGAFLQPNSPLHEGLISKLTITPYDNIEKIIHNILSEL